MELSTEDTSLILVMQKMQKKLQELQFWLNKKYEETSYNGVVIITGSQTHIDNCQGVIDSIIADFKPMAAAMSSGNTVSKVKPEDPEGDPLKAVSL